MKIPPLLIIGIGFFIVALAISHFFFLETFAAALFQVIIIESVIALGFFIGYFMIYLLEKKDTYNMLTAILMPLLPIILLLLMASLTLVQLVYWLLAFAPFLLIASSFGGVWAHKKRAKQFVKKI